MQLCVVNSVGIKLAHVIGVERMLEILITAECEHPLLGESGNDLHAWGEHLSQSFKSRNIAFYQAAECRPALQRERICSDNGPRVSRLSNRNVGDTLPVRIESFQKVE